MKKHQLTAMLLSALSAGIIISCTKPNEDTGDVESHVDNKTVAPLDSNAATTDNMVTTDNTVVTQDKLTTSTGEITAISLSAATTHDYLTHVANAQIIPAYEEVAKQSKVLNSLALQHCQAGTLESEKLPLLQQQWLSLAKAWASAEIINFGPAMDSMSNLYINYYPDERGQVHQGVIDLIDANPALTPEQLSSESAVVQGLPGMEEVLFTNKALSKGQCQYIVSASSALQQRLQAVQTQWETNSAQLLGTDKTLKSDNINNLGMNRWINGLLSLVETTKSNVLDKPLGLTGNKKGHLPAAAAGQSKAIITAKIAGLSRALTDPMLVAILAQNGQDTLADDMSTVLADISALLAQLPDDIAKADTTEQQALYDKLTKLTQIIKRQLMPVLGVQVGFNSTDGD